jgi:hypothetical protein
MSSLSGGPICKSFGPALALIRDVVEQLAPVGAMRSSEAVLATHGPEPHHEAGRVEFQAARRGARSRQSVSEPQPQPRFVLEPDPRRAQLAGASGRSLPQAQSADRRAVVSRMHRYGARPRNRFAEIENGTRRTRFHRPRPAGMMIWRMPLLARCWVASEQVVEIRAS